MEERLNKIIATAGLASRRKAEEMILQGEVTVNGEIVSDVGAKADPEIDHIKVSGKLINPLLEHKKNIYILLNKPRGYLASLSDPQQRPLVTKLLPNNLPRVHPVGRLDFNTEGLLILTNDGALTKKITSAAEHVAKVYEVKVKGTPTELGLKRISQGIAIDGKMTAPSKVKKLEISDAGNAWFEITLYEGRNNQIRKMFDLIGHSVVKLRRIKIGHLTDSHLPVGKHRFLTEEEIAPFLKSKQEAKSKDEKPAPKPREGSAVAHLVKKGPAKKRENKTE